VVDDGNYLQIQAANGFTFNPKIMTDGEFKSSFFVLKRYESQKRNFSFEIGFDYQLNYEELTKESFDVQCDIDSDIYRANGVYFKMINFDN